MAPATLARGDYPPTRDAPAHSTHGGSRGQVCGRRGRGREVARSVCPSPDGSNPAPCNGGGLRPRTEGGRDSRRVRASQTRLTDNRESPRGPAPRPEASGYDNMTPRRIRRPPPAHRPRARLPSAQRCGGQWYPRESDQHTPPRAARRRWGAAVPRTRRCCRSVQQHGLPADEWLSDSPEGAIRVRDPGTLPGRVESHGYGPAPDASGAYDGRGRGRHSPTR